MFSAFRKGWSSAAPAFASRRSRSRAVGSDSTQDLDRDAAVEARVVGVVDLAHATRADGRNNLVGTESSAGRQWHVIDSARV